MITTEDKCFYGNKERLRKHQIPMAELKELVRLYMFNVTKMLKNSNILAASTSSFRC